jgi:hypothetical protein
MFYLFLRAFALTKCPNFQCHYCFEAKTKRALTIPAAFFCLRYHYACHFLLLVHQNLSVAPRAVVYKHAFYAAVDATICGLFVLPFNEYNLLTIEGSHGSRVFYRVEYAVVIVSFLKLSFPLRLLIDSVLDKFNNSLVLRKLAYFNPNAQFALKIIIRNSPMKFALMSWAFIVGLGAYILRIAEAPAAQNSMDYSQMLWMSVVTSLTLGYGDVVPKSYIGRSVMAATIIASMALIAVSIVFLGSFLELKSSERHIVKIHTHAVMMKELENGAASFLTKWLGLMIQKKKRRGKWSVELHWTVLEVVRQSNHMSLKSIYKRHSGIRLEDQTQHVDVRSDRLRFDVDLTRFTDRTCGF